MKSPHRILVAVIALFALQLVASAQDAAKGAHWYCFDIEHHNAIAATSSLTPEQLAKALAGTEFIRLDAAREFNGAGEWNIPKAPFTETLFVRPTTVRSFVPLTGPPMDAK
ncbi:MAG TPA: hypothetical protein VFD27_22850 [Chthoniobacteraceae bacterium]|nr:hypothetical protein [Chthoniobacteraceae bacterium]